MASEEVSTTMESERVSEEAEDEENIDDDQVIVRPPHVLDGKRIVLYSINTSFVTFIRCKRC